MQELKHTKNIKRDTTCKREKRREKKKRQRENE